MPDKSEEPEIHVYHLPHGLHGLTHGLHGLSHGSHGLSHGLLHGLSHGSHGLLHGLRHGLRHLHDLQVRRAHSASNNFFSHSILSKTFLASAIFFCITQTILVSCFNHLPTTLLPRHANSSPGGPSLPQPLEEQTLIEWQLPLSLIYIYVYIIIRLWIQLTRIQVQGQDSTKTHAERRAIANSLKSIFSDYRKYWWLQRIVQWFYTYSCIWKNTNIPKNTIIIVAFPLLGLFFREITFHKYFFFLYCFSWIQNQLHVTFIDGRFSFYFIINVCKYWERNKSDIEA